MKKWNGIIEVISPAGRTIKRIERIIRGRTEEIAERNARYIARPWLAEGCRLVIELRPLALTE